LQIAKELVKNGIGEEHIGIITPYNSQANVIRGAVCMTSLEIHTIDKYQVRLKAKTNIKGLCRSCELLQKLNHTTE